MADKDVNGARLLIGAALLSFLVAALHLVVIVVGPPGYAYMGAPELGELARRGSAMPALVTAVLAVVFCVFGLYALAGARRFRPLPLLPFVLLAVGAVYTLRGLVLPLELSALLRGAASFPPRYAAFSAASLVIGCLYLAGTARAWGRLRRHPRAPDPQTPGLEQA